MMQMVQYAAIAAFTLAALNYSVPPAQAPDDSKLTPLCDPQQRQRDVRRCMHESFTKPWKYVAGHNEGGGVYWGQRADKMKATYCKAPRPTHLLCDDAD